VIVNVLIPVLPESIPDATLLEWNKQAGEHVAEDEVLVELETDKVVLEVPAPAAGVLMEIIKQAGDIALANEVIARIDTEGVAAAQAPVQKEETPTAHAADPLAGAGPAARKAVSESNLDPATITASGPGGRITKGDVIAAAGRQPATPSVASAPAEKADTTASKPTSPSASPSSDAPSSSAARSERRVPMSRLRQRIAERLVEAQTNAAILTTFNEVNMGPVMALRKRLRDDFEKAHGVRLGFMSFFAKAAVQALQRFPAVNAYVEGTEMVYHDYCDIGVAVGSPRGLVVPVLRNVEAMSFADIEGQITNFGERAQAGSLGLEELSGGTFTISNGGVFGSMLSTPILNPPQSGILGMHKTQERPMVEDGQIVVRPIMYLALSYDHRVVDGREAVQFLVTIKECIEDPGRLLLGV
jgi:2-oxoglutarate dehydrogenase E2 component (dihydrolipoamide succinyltransferase)